GWGLAVLAAAAGLRPWQWLTEAGGAETVESASTGARTGGGAVLPYPLPKPLPASDPPIGGGAKGRFRIYTVTRMPDFDPAVWRFRVNGLVQRPLELTWEEFLRLPRTVAVHDFHCVTGWSVRNVTWEGIPLSQLLQHVGLRPEATHVKFYSGDGVYTDALSVPQALAEGSLVAVLKDGKPLTKEEGGPVRLVVPSMYGYKSVKWLEAVEAIDRSWIGYWEERGYDVDAYLRESVLSVTPFPGDRFREPDLSYGAAT
ncbi:MAG: molybdopterin-dependent oxidoreductase, partial [Clostridia bacterium]|nr:molybdopterin-dependent oxidoreductase [Clostridia bacterium]